MKSSSENIKSIIYTSRIFSSCNHSEINSENCMFYSQTIQEEKNFQLHLLHWKKGNNNWNLL